MAHLLICLVGATGMISLLSLEFPQNLVLLNAGPAAKKE